MGNLWCRTCCCRECSAYEEELVQSIRVTLGSVRRTDGAGASAEVVTTEYVALPGRDAAEPALVPQGGAGSAAPTAATADEQKKQAYFATPPSIEDEKRFMRASFRSILERQEKAPKECLLCLDGFSDNMPEVHTLCRCGVNRYSYHLVCLLEWRARSGKTTCPVCDQELYFEEDGAVAVRSAGAAAAAARRRPGGGGGWSASEV